MSLLQVIKARFGKGTHLVFCTFAFFTNLIVMMSLTVAGTAVLNSLVADLSPELAAMLLAVVIGGYTLIGGLGATFYSKRSADAEADADAYYGYYPYAHAYGHHGYAHHGYAHHGYYGYPYAYGYYGHH